MIRAPNCNYDRACWLTRLDVHKYFTSTPSSVTRGHPYKLYKAQCEYSKRRNFFTERIVDVWNLAC